MPLGDGIRRSFAKVTQAERDRFILAVQKMHDDPAFQFSDGVGFYQKQEATHELAHGTPVSPHDPATFMVWHRELVNRFETLLRVVDPDLSLHYWDWTEDPRSASDGMGGTVNLMTAATMGSPNGDVGVPFENFETLPAWDPGHTVIWRAVPPGPPPGGTSDSVMAAKPDFQAFSTAMSTPHSNAHDYLGGTLSIEHIAASDPFFFLFHSNVDRVFALWQLQAGHQERLDGNTVFGPLSGDPALTQTMVPWDGSTGEIPWVMGNTEPTGGIDAKTPKDPSVVTPPCYDTNPPQISVWNPGSVINFNDVPAGETAMRAARFDCLVCKVPLHFSVTAGPSSPYGVLAGSVIVNPKAGTQEARIWLTFTGTTPNTSAPAGSVTIHCDETGDDFNFTINGNTIARPTVAVELVLDQSGSMDWDAGTTGIRRMDVLKSAAGVFADVIQGGNAAGLVRFDHLAYGPGDPTFPGLGVTNVGDPAADPGRVALHGAIDSHNTNTAGGTSIGAGVELGLDQLNPVTGFDKKAMIVFTDGEENTPPMIHDLMAAGSINSQIFAIGLGSATELSTAALTELTNNTGGYFRLTDTLTPDTDAFFRTKKYFLQILAGVQNNEIVIDPTGKILPGQIVYVPFPLNDADIESTVILLTDLPAVRMQLLTPAGDLIDPAVASTVGVDYTVGQGVFFYRFRLPVALGAGAQSGTWQAILEMDPAIVRRCQEDQHFGLSAAFVANKPAVCAGVRYSVQIHAWSNLRMQARVLQTSLEPGATMTVRAVLTEYGMPVDYRATVSAGVTRPDGTGVTLSLTEVEPGVFEATTQALIPGVYFFLVSASGKTIRGQAFSRQQLLTGAVLFGGDDPLPTGGEREWGEVVCRLLSCLLGDPALQGVLKEKGIDVGRLLRCLEEECAKQPRSETREGVIRSGLQALGVTAGTTEVARTRVPPR